MSELKAIVYTSCTGHTEAYAKLMGEETGLPVYSLQEAAKQLEKGAAVLYFGWLFAGNIKGFAKVKRRYRVRAVCGVGLCENGCLLEKARRAAKIPAETPFYTLQGGMDRDRLKGINRAMINMLIRMLSKKQEKTEEEKAQLALLEKGGNYVSRENIDVFCDFLKKESIL